MSFKKRCMDWEMNSADVSDTLTPATVESDIPFTPATNVYRRLAGIGTSASRPVEIARLDLRKADTKEIKMETTEPSDTLSINTKNSGDLQTQNEEFQKNVASLCEFICLKNIAHELPPHLKTLFETNITPLQICILYDHLVIDIQTSFRELSQENWSEEDSSGYVLSTINCLGAMTTSLNKLRFLSSLKPDGLCLAFRAIYIIISAMSSRFERMTHDGGHEFDTLDIVMLELAKDRQADVHNSRDLDD
ncbi:hypothetical protein MMC25_007265 [Agyrium rufum]|nr:hypothetical protein [Agyrium rufum]